MYKKLSILTLLILILTITVSFAWMMELGGQRGHYVEFDYDKSIYISPNNLDIDILLEENGSYVSLYSTKNEENNLVKFENSEPGKVYKFCMKINNLTTNPISTSILLSEITSTIDDFYNYISVGIFSTKGFDAKYKAPALEEFTIASRIKKDSDGNIMNSINFVDNLSIPPKNQEVEIKFYIRFINTRENQNHLQNQNFTIGKINFMCI